METNDTDIYISHEIGSVPAPFDWEPELLDWEHELQVTA